MKTNKFDIICIGFMFVVIVFAGFDRYIFHLRIVYYYIILAVIVILYIIAFYKSVIK